MIRKSALLVSTGLFAIATPAFAQTAVSTTDTDKQAAQPTPGATEGAAAQDQAREQQPVDTGDIVITATRRNQALSDVPMAVSAVTAEICATPARPTSVSSTRSRRRCRSSRPRRKAAPRRANIRGIGTVGDNPGLESSVGVFIDGVYRSRSGVGLTELGPLDRIEVLRGPQGTLFGRNTSAGLISIITAKPRFTPEVQRPGRRRQLQLAAHRGRASPGRSATPSRRGWTASMSSATASSRMSCRAGESTTATAGCCAARSCSSRATISRSV